MRFCQDLLRASGVAWQRAALGSFKCGLGIAGWGTSFGAVADSPGGGTTCGLVPPEAW